MLDETARGVYVIAVTPFTDEGALDLNSIDRMVDFYVAAGVNGLTILGQLGEAAKLTAKESRTVVERVVKRTQLPIIVGVTAAGLAPMTELTQVVMGAGAAGVMVAPPWTVRTDEQAHKFFFEVGEALGSTPFVLQDYPLTTGVTIAPKLIELIIRDVPNMKVLKHEDWPGLAKISSLRAASDRGDIRRISILTGNGGLFLPEELGRGADGAMTGFCYPEMMVSVVREYAAGNTGRAHDIFDAYLPLVRYEQQQGIGLAVRKYVLQKRGIIRSASLRKPGPALSQADLIDIERLLVRQELRLRQVGA